jgi:hypothetical protein
MILSCVPGCVLTKLILSCVPVWVLTKLILPFVPGCLFSKLTMSCISGCVFSGLILLTLCGNTLVLVAIATNKSLQRPCNFFLASLAVADLGVSSILLAK